ncbi:MAG: Molybdenum ABC transporter permease protein ModB [uncultured Thermomicrobiales bacterium]|uniref:Molybdenum transport system permease protein ModB n=1 Tax=uncultured Thermomicrobiales bacterium TaxID=1645740 RepID=A0A6J4VWN0_9BACT|nr:MAG: Molybdenum ABC transporter permease protein ModB [uncultured Thermomicrobiales bacterium]
MTTQPPTPARPLAGRAQTEYPGPVARPGRPVSLALLFGPPSLLFVGLVLLLPLVALVWRTAESDVFLASVQKPIVIQALRLTAWTSLVTLLLSVALGTPLAYGLARARFPGKRIVDTLVDLPIVLPPVVAGVGLLMAFGRRGLVGQYLQTGFTLPLLDIRVPELSLSFSTTAVILAQLFVSAPFFIRAARAAFAETDREVEDAAAIDGATPWQIFRLVTVPLAIPALSSGLVLCWARAVGEFGATMMFAGNFIGRTQTMPLAIMGAMESDLYAALALSVLLVILSFLALFAYRLLGARRGLAL